MYRPRRNLGEIAGLHEDMQRLLGLSMEPAQAGSFRRGAWLPALDIYESEDAVTVCIDLPGVRSEDLDVTVEDGVLVVRGVRHPRAAEDANYHRIERPVGEFSRSVQLPRKVEAGKITAALDEGVLRIRIPVPEAPQPVKIAVTESAKTKSGKGRTE